MIGVLLLFSALQTPAELPQPVEDGDAAESVTFPEAAPLPPLDPDDVEEPEAPAGQDFDQPLPRRRPPAPPADLPVADNTPHPALGWTSVLLGALAGLPPWLPALVLCSSGCVLVGLIWPVSLGDPTSSTLDGSRLWTSVACAGLTAGSMGWLVAIPTALSAGLLGTAGVLFGGLVRALFLETPSTAWPVRVFPVMAGGAAALLATVPSVALSVGAGLLAMWALSGLAVNLPFERGPGYRSWWLQYNLARNTFLLLMMGAMLCALTLPPVAGVLAHVVTRSGLMELTQ